MLINTRAPFNEQSTALFPQITGHKHAKHTENVHEPANGFKTWPSLVLRESDMRDFTPPSLPFRVSNMRTINRLREL